MELHPEIPEGINHSKTHPLADFFYMLVGIVLIVLTIFLLAQVLAGVMVRFISFETEQALYQKFAPDEPGWGSEEYPEKTEYLQSLAESLSPHMDLPEGMVVRVSYDPSGIANAYASLAGNIVIYQGLIDEISTENGLAMVIAHEIAHIKNRDPLMSLGRGTVSLIGLAVLVGMGDSSAVGNVVNIAGGGLLAKFSRTQEEMADQDAVNAMLGLYGSLEGADEFFVNMSEEESELGVLFFSTHPATNSRIERIADMNTENQNGTENLIPLPEVLIESAEIEVSAPKD